MGWGEILAWSQLTGEQLEPWEAEAVKDLDHLFLKAHTEDPKTRT